MIVAGRKISSNFYGFLSSALILSIWTVSAFAETESGPRIFVKDRTFDFGTVKQGASVTQAFSLENKGQQPLQILDVQADCGCTVAQPESKTIESKNSSKLNVVFDTSGFHGYKVKTVRVYTNDSKNSPISLSLKGNIQRDVDVKPARLYFGNVPKGGDLVKSVKFQRFSSDDISITEVVSRSEFVKVKLSDTGFDVKLSNDIPFGVFRDKILVKTNSPETPIIHLPIFARISGDITAKPADISFGLLRAPLVEEEAREIILKNGSGKELKLLSLKSDTKGILVESKADKLKDSVALVVKLKPGVEGVLHGKVTVETDHPDPQQKLLTIPVYGIVAKKGA